MVRVLRRRGELNVLFQEYRREHPLDESLRQRRLSLPTLELISRPRPLLSRLERKEKLTSALDDIARELEDFFEANEAHCEALIARKLVLCWAISEVLKNYLEGMAVIGSTALGLFESIHHEEYCGVGDIDLVMIPNDAAWNIFRESKRSREFFIEVSNRYCECIGDKEWSDSAEVGMASEGMMRRVLDGKSFSGVDLERVELLDNCSKKRLEMQDIKLRMISYLTCHVDFINPRLFDELEQYALQHSTPGDQREVIKRVGTWRRLKRGDTF